MSHELFNSIMLVLIFAAGHSFTSILGGLAATVILIGLVTLFVIIRDRLLFGKSYVAARARAETICSWEYSAAEWRKFASEFEVSKNPEGECKVRITSLDLWFIDSGGTIRKPIASKAMMVAGCRYTPNLLKIRVRSHITSPRRDFYDHRDYLIPVPAGREREAQKAVKFFTDYRDTHPGKLDWVTPRNALTGLFNESDF